MALNVQKAHDKLVAGGHKNEHKQNILRAESILEGVKKGKINTTDANERLLKFGYKLEQNKAKEYLLKPLVVNSQTEGNVVPPSDPNK